ncbi:MAG: circadian clock protein KaiC, partial [Sedimentisphaerales bacterium]|nr:circadian clock protein KaiC [Sedimentisphaerales bacterium]
LKSGGRQLAKCPTGIKGLDEITSGGIPRGRPTLVCGGAGCGKTLLGMEFLYRGITDFNEPGVFLAFEESIPELEQNIKSLGWDVDKLVRQKKLAIDQIAIERREIIESGEYDLEGLFVRLGQMIDSVGAKRIVLDTLEVLFSSFSDQFVIRAELTRLFRWLKKKGVTVVITAEHGETTLTRHGLEEYVSDCVIVMDHRMNQQIATRRMRVLKYRGSSHGTNEYPFLIDEDGISVLPLTSAGLAYDVGTKRISSGIPSLDAMLEGKGYFQGSSILVSGTAGTGKTSLSGYFVDEACRKGMRCLYVAMEEAQNQVVRNMRSINLNLQPWVDKGLLKYHAARPTICGLEMHLAMLHKLINQYNPKAIVIDPISSFLAAGIDQDVRSMLTRLIDFCKSRQITTLFTDQSSASNASLEQAKEEVSSLMDSWLLLRDIELNGERNRLIYLLKSRGMAHSNQVREFRMTDKGIELVKVYVGPGTVLTGSARVQQETRDSTEAAHRREEAARTQQELEGKRKAAEAQVVALHAELAILEGDSKRIAVAESARLKNEEESRNRLWSARKKEGTSNRKNIRKQ